MGGLSADTCEISGGIEETIFDALATPVLPTILFTVLPVVALKLGEFGIIAASSGTFTRMEFGRTSFTTPGQLEK